MAAMRIPILAIAFLFLLSSSFGVDPTYKDCRPHIDATIRDLASKALHAGEEPPEELPAHVYDEGSEAHAPTETEPSVENVPESAAPEDAEEISPKDHVAPTFEISTDDQTPNVEAAEILSESDPPPELDLDPKLYDEAREQVPVSPEAPETASAPMEEERIPDVQQQPSVQEVPEASVPTPVPEMVVPPPPVPPVPEYTSPSPPAGNPTPVYTPPPSVQKENIINRAIYALFGINPETRDAKWAQPWNTHEEHRRAPREEKKTAAIDASPNFIGQYINKMVELAFGKVTYERDEKWAQPWQSHPEHQKKPISVSEQPAKKVYVPSEGIFHKFIVLVFGNVKGERDSKYAQPWQTHAEHKKQERIEQPSEKLAIQASGGILDKLIRVVFPTELGERDPKYAKPWQTHQEHTKSKVEESAPAKQVKAVPIGGPIDKLVKMLFNLPTDVERNPKYAQPWQTHEEHSRKQSEPKEKVVVKTTGALPGFGFVDKAIKAAFGEIPENRDEKWAQPWPTHPEHKRSAAPAKVVEKKVMPVEGGLFDGIIRSLFGLSNETKRDPKWSEPWTSHNEHRLKVSNPTPAAPQPAAPTPRPAVPASQPPTHQAAAPAHQPAAPQPAAPAPQPAAPAPQPAAPAPQPAASAPQPAASAPQPAASAPQPVAPAPAPRPAAPERQPSAPQVVSKAGTDSDEEKPTADKLEKSNEAETTQTSQEAVEKFPVEEQDANRKKKTKFLQTPVVRTSREEDDTRKQVERQSQKKGASVQKQQTTKISTKHRRSGTKNKLQLYPDDSGEVQADISTPSTPSAVVDSAPTQDQQDGGFEEDDNQEQIILVPSSPRSRLHIDSILGLDEPSRENYRKADPIAEATLRNLMNVYASNVKPLEDTYKYNDISNRHMSDSALFGQPLVLMLGPYSTGKSSFLNYLMGIEYTRRALRTGANPSHGVFRIIQYGDSDMELDGTALSADLNFRSLQKFGQNFVDQLKGHALNVPLLKKVTFVEAPGILEMRRAGERLYPFNDVLQWFIDRADLVLVMFDYTKLDAGYELEAALDQLKGREAQVRILLNKADQIPPEELIKVQGSLFWNLSPLLGVTTPPTVYAGSFSSRPYRTSSPAQLFQAQEEALLHDIAKAVNNRVDNRVAVARRHAVRVRNHAQMVDTYLNTYNKNKGFLTSKHKLAEDIVENPHLYNIYEGMSLLTNISRYDLPDPEGYRDFFRVHNLYDFPTLKGACSFVHGCPLDKIDKAINTELPELLSRYRQQLVKAGVSFQLPQTDNFHGGRQTLPEAQHSKY